MSTRFSQLLVGYVDNGGASCFSAATDADLVVVIDPGKIRSRNLSVDVLSQRRYCLFDVTDVVVSHRQVDQAIKVAMFANYRPRKVLRW